MKCCFIFGTVEGNVSKKIPDPSAFVKSIWTNTRQLMLGTSTPLFWHQMFHDTILGFQGLKINVVYGNPSMYAKVYVSYQNRLNDDACDDIVGSLSPAVPANTEVYFYKVTIPSDSEGNANEGELRVDKTHETVVNEKDESHLYPVNITSFGERVTTFGNNTYEIRRWQICENEESMSYHQKVETTAMWMIDGTSRT